MCKGSLIAAVGMFDGVHRGHQFMLDSLTEAARSRGLQPTVITFSLHPIASLKPGSEPTRLSTNASRAQLLRRGGAERIMELNFDAVHHMPASSFLRTLQDMDVRTLLMGFNNHIGCDRLPLLKVAKLGLMEVIGARPSDELSHISSSAIRKALDEGDIDYANDMLGRTYTIEGSVVAGNQLGRTIGFPTANITPDEPCIQVPADGVYAVTLTIGDETIQRPGMANIGVRPTVAQGASIRTIEVNIFDFDDDIYGRHVELAFIARLRDEQRFNSVDELAAAIKADRDAAETIFSKLNA